MPPAQQRRISYGIRREEERSERGDRPERGNRNERGERSAEKAPREESTAATGERKERRPRGERKERGERQQPEAVENKLMPELAAAEGAVANVGSAGEAVPESGTGEDQGSRARGTRRSGS